MTDDPRPPDEPGRPATHLHELRGDIRWLRLLAPSGAILLAVAGLLTIYAPSVRWFLLYPILIIGALAALGYAAAYLLRHF